MLCEAGAKQWIPDLMGYTPLDYAGKFECWDVVYFLIKKGTEECKVSLQETE
jgi:ankyrin repeat protein